MTGKRRGRMGLQLWRRYLFPQRINHTKLWWEVFSKEEEVQGKWSTGMEGPWKGVTWRSKGQAQSYQKEKRVRESTRQFVQVVTLGSLTPYFWVSMAAWEKVWGLQSQRNSEWPLESFLKKSLLDHVPWIPTGESKRAYIDYFFPTSDHTVLEIKK